MYFIAILLTMEETKKSAVNSHRDWSATECKVIKT